MTEGVPSKFWGTGDSDEEEEEEHTEEGSEGEGAADEEQRGSRWLTRGVLSSDDEDDMPEKRRVRTAAEKALDEFRDALSDLRDHTSNIDVSSVNLAISDLEHLQRAFEKASGVGLKPFPPRVYLRALVLLEDWTKAIAEDKEQKRTAGSKPFSTLRNKLRTACKPFEAELTAHRANPGEEDEDEEEEEEEGEEEMFADEDEKKKKTKPTSAAGPAIAFGDEEKDEEEVEEDEDADVYRGEEQDAASKWKVKGPRVSEDAAAAEARKQRREQKRVQQAERQPQEQQVLTPEEEEEQKKKKEAEAEKPLTDEDIAAKHVELAMTVGKRGTDAAKLVMALTELAGKAKAPLLRLRMLITACAAQLSAAAAAVAGAITAVFMPVSMWRRLHALTSQILELLVAEPEYRLVGQAEAEADEEAAKTAGDPGKVRKVMGSLLSLVERLDDELLASYQNLDIHKSEYSTRQADETPFMEMMQRAYTYLEKIGDNAAAVRVAARIAEHLHYRATASIAQLQTMASFIYKHGDERLKARVVLHQVYLHAVQGRYHDARDLLLRTHLQEGVPSMDIPTQILHNRAITQIGLCAFRNGLIAEAHSCLSDLYSPMATPRELLGQGISQPRFVLGAPMPERDPRQEAEERKRLVPYHTHINLDLVESVNLISAMLVEIPAAAAGASLDPRKRSAGKSFRKVLESVERQLFTGPPQSTRDIVVVASRALQTGDWRRCSELVLGLKAWAQLPTPDTVKAMLKQRIQEAGLRTFLLTNAQHYQSILIESLVGMFELPESTVRCLVSRMVIAEELHASFDQPTGALVPQHAEPNRLQTLALSLADKVAAFVESNERLIDSRTGTYGYKFEQKQDQPASLWAPRQYARGSRAPGSYQRASQQQGQQGRSRYQGRGAPTHRAQQAPQPSM